MEETATVLKHGTTVKFYNMDTIVVKDQNVQLDQIYKLLKPHFRSMNPANDSQLLVNLVRKPTGSNCVMSMLGPNFSSSEFSLLDYFRLVLFKYRQFVITFKNKMKVRNFLLHLSNSDKKKKDKTNDMTDNLHASFSPFSVFPFFPFSHL